MILQGTLMALWLNKWLKVCEGSGQREGPDKLFYSISLSIPYNGKESRKEYIHIHTYIVCVCVYIHTHNMYIYLAIICLPMCVCRHIIAKYIYMYVYCRITLYTPETL